MGERGVYRDRQHPPRSRVVKVKLTEDEYERLADGATRARMALATYVATTALQAADGTAADSARIRALQEALSEVMMARTQVSRYGNNVNQAVKRFHENGVPPRWLKDAVVTVDRALARLDEHEAMLGKLVRALRKRRY